ncbi:MAG: hypothetical protein PHO26_05565 [Dehalococcoidia bacterium]|nr:hypothetical protein [Dehalococcoidia bacterium]MDD5494779.1 hypothetical protein [Dehalococcoidia bacterium]
MKIIIIVLVSLIALIGCVQVSPPQASLPPSILEFEATPASVVAGSPSSLKWQVAGATAVSIDQGIGNVERSSTYSVNPTTTTIYTLTAENSYGSVMATAQVVVTSGEPPVSNLPIVAVFSAKPANIVAEMESTITWDVKNSFDVSIEPNFGPIKPAGSRVVTPPFTTNYILTAVNSTGILKAATTITVSGVMPSAETPVIKSFTANPPMINKGATSTLSWESVEGSSATIDHDVGVVAGSGTRNVSPASTTVYTLTVTNPRGAQFQTAVVNVR